MKYFYIVRHGETILNKAHIRQGAEGKLSPEGVAQAEDVGQRLSYMHIKKMFVSPYERTEETASLINKYVKLKPSKIITAPLLHERTNPSNIIGLHYDDPKAEYYYQIMDYSFHDPNLRISDGENFMDLKKRALKTQEYLIRHGVKRNLCVTHGIFLKMFLSTLIYGQNLTEANWVELTTFNPSDNAALTLVSYSPWKDFKRSLHRFFEGKKARIKEKGQVDKYSPWTILAYNDYSRKDGDRMSV